MSFPGNAAFLLGILNIFDIEYTLNPIFVYTVIQTKMEFQTSGTGNDSKFIIPE